MGLCKCPKKKVTNLFCFEHRVNVCENCLVANHQKCIVKSYLQWLQDSDYNPSCVLCNKNLSDEDCGECVRLTCYDVFHWFCLNKYAQQLPPHTAPAGYTCPTCKSGIFPPQNAVSPIAEALKQHLSKVNWARAGLGLPLIEGSETPIDTPKQFEENKHVPVQDTPVKKELAQTTMTATPAKSSPNHTRPSAHVSPTINSVTQHNTINSVTQNSITNPGSQHSVISVDSGTTVRGSDKAYGVVGKYSIPIVHVLPNINPVTQANDINPATQQHNVISVDSGTAARGSSKTYNVVDPRKMFDTTKDDLLNMSSDHDENKYRRRGAMEWLKNWLKSREVKGKKKDPAAVRKKFFLVILFGLIGFITIIIIFHKLGRGGQDDDPLLEMMANPNIRVNEGK